VGHLGRFKNPTNLKILLPPNFGAVEKPFISPCPTCFPSLAYSLDLFFSNSPLKWPVITPQSTKGDCYSPSQFCSQFQRAVLLEFGVLDAPSPTHFVLSNSFLSDLLYCIKHFSSHLLCSTESNTWFSFPISVSLRKTRYEICHIQEGSVQ
jgi:hypothetical protein